MVTLLTGASGAIGRNLKESIPGLLCPTHSELDLTNMGQTRKYLSNHKVDSIIHCASNDKEVCVFDNLRMFVNLADTLIPMITFCTGREVEDRMGKSGEYILSKHIIKELALSKYGHITVIKIWGCFGKYERDIRFFTNNFNRVKQGLPILVTEDKLFSYVYVNDLVRIINQLPICNWLVKIVGYTESLLDYAKIIKKVTQSPYEIIIEKENYSNSYIGLTNYLYDYTPLEEAIKEFWHDFNNNTK